LSKSKDELYIIGVDFKNNRDKYKKILNTKNPSWNDLNEHQGFPFKSGEHYRQFIKKRQDRDGTLKKLEVNKEIIKDEMLDKKLSSLDLKEIELKKERIRLGDQRSKLNTLIRQSARSDGLKELLESSIKNGKFNDFEFTIPKHQYGEDNEMIIPISDSHYALTIDNEFEKYNTDVFLERLANYTMQILDIKKTHKINTCHIAFLGDLISGVHMNIIRYSNQENVVSQVQNFSEYMVKFLDKISQHFENMNIYFVTGNHARNFQDKKESIDSERYENFIIWYLKARMFNHKNIVFHDSILDNTIAIGKVKGNTCFFTHGDKDTPSRIVEKLTLMIGEIPKLIYFGHSHHFSADTIQKVKTIMSGSFCVNDSYCTGIRVVGEPSQTVSIIDDNGLKCIYDCKLK